jgi:hypothetical protein
MRTATTALVGTTLLGAVLLVAGCRKPPGASAPAPGAAPPAAAPAANPAPAPHLGGALPGKAQTLPRQAMDLVRKEKQLHQIGIYLVSFQGEQMRYPNSLQEFLDYIKRDLREEHESLQTGYFVMTLDPRPAAGAVVVYEKDPDMNGKRSVLLGDGSVQRMTEDEFNKAVPKAGK